MVGHDQSGRLADLHCGFDLVALWLLIDPEHSAVLSMSVQCRVEMWRGGCRLNISVAASFVWRCLSGSAMAPFPHPAHRTGHADFPHPALGQDFTPSPTARCAQAGTGVRARMPVKVPEWISSALASPDLVLEAQPPAQPHSGVVVDRPVRLREVPSSSSSPIRAACGSTSSPALWSLAKCPIGQSARGHSRPCA